MTLAFGSLYNKGLIFFSFLFHSFLFYFLGDETWVMRGNSLLDLTNMM